MKISADGKATLTRSAFRMAVAVGILIQARPETVWTLVTNAADFPRWNSTIRSIEGRIAPGETIILRNTTAPDRTFRLKVTTFEPPRLMIWRDGMAPMFKGVRRYTLTARQDHATEFIMLEEFSGLMLPLIGGALPDFRSSFEQYAADLKREAERSA